MMSNSFPERWSIDGGDAAIVRLEIPADQQRERRFEIGCAMTVRALEIASGPWHELRVYADGELQWSRRVPTLQPSPYDGLDFRFARTLPVGRPLRVQAVVAGAGMERLSLVIEADEIP